MSRYRVVGSAAECEPGSDDLVLSNRLGITDPAAMERVERDLLLDLYQTIIGNGAPPNNRLRLSGLIGWHRQWLGSVYSWAGYSWAGKVRTFNLSKQAFAFASAHLLPDLVKSFESKYLGRLTPFNPDSMGALIRGLAEVHVEFVLIHPFREGNGRIARLLADVMACLAGAVLNVTPMEDLFRQVLTGRIVDS